MADADTARAALAAIRPGALEYDEWLATGMAAKAAGLSLAEWEQWCAQDTARYNPRELPGKWASFRGNSQHPVGVGTLVKLARDQGAHLDLQPEGRALEWDATIGPHEPLQVVRQEWLQDEALPPAPNGNWDGRKDLATYLRALFDVSERVGYVTECYEQAADGGKRWAPRRGVWDRTAGELLEVLTQAKTLPDAIGDWHKDAGAWIRFNPLDGNGCSDQNVTVFRFALVESDDISVERQHAIYRQLELPIAALVHSGGKSLHAIVRIEAPTFAEYQKRVDFLYDVAKKNGLVIDRKNRNPSRLSRLPGATRGDQRQWLVATNVGKASWAEWADWIAAQNDDLPAVECLADFLGNLPPLADVLIADVLRKGHKLLLAGPANAGKSLALLALAIAIAEGKRWLGWQCSQGRVLYVNLEVDRASCLHRLAAVYAALGITPEHAADIDVWNLRGQAQALDQLTPRLIRRAAKAKYAAIIIDPIYKVLTGDENAAHEMARFCNQFDRIARELGCAVVYCHHHSKGSQGQKGAADRASGSGVFKRDPDALIDLVELIVPEALRAQVVNRAECDALAGAFDAEMPAWRDQCPPDDALVADKLVAWADGAGLGEAVREVRPRARAAAEAMSGWRLECGTCREFARFAPRRLWFRYPLHVLDADGLLDDAIAEGEVPESKRSPKEAGEAKAARFDADTRNAVDACRNAAGVVRLADVVEFLGLSERGTRERVKKSGFTVKHGLIEKDDGSAENN